MLGNGATEIGKSVTVNDVKNQPNASMGIFKTYTDGRDTSLGVLNLNGRSANNIQQQKPAKLTILPIKHANSLAKATLAAQDQKKQSIRTLQLAGSIEKIVDSNN